MNGEVIIKEMDELKEKVDVHDELLAMHSTKHAIAEVKFGTIGTSMDKLADAIEKDREQKFQEAINKPKQIISDGYKLLGLFITVILGFLALYFK